MKSGEIQVLKSSEEIQNRIRELGAEITRDYAGKELTVIGILKGSFIFMADLVREIKVPVHCEFLSVSSYGSATKSSGEVKLNLDVNASVAGKHVLIVEDIVDSGLTLHFLLELFQVRGPASLKVAALLDKPGARRIDVAANYLGFSIGDDFVIGYGLDYAEKYRELPFVGHFPNTK